ncbi:MAG: hypothetical protein KUA35_11610 [Pseudodesulfovibrio sp.]|nr:MULTISPECIES: hypothetical protein [Pseudodesulfovibrio]MBU4191445.1 hypothetical protein [Pseudomonadota bacterium]MBU4244877.1 hypothetical protein [Pseudomonadota bacterium]MBU4380082.1 hypothetical protein [Pseudomonadota bacterium]MBU4475752.1 hypothetical protein [Pseudomonadota bacterium]MBU4516653.1 hypothetical protein [Pseudomonadota bacterium]
MRFQYVVAAAAILILWSGPAVAGLPYYNQTLGYTIWLSGGWAEVPGPALDRFRPLSDGVAPLPVGWEAGYVMEAPAPVCLLVSRLPGRVVSKDHIANFNRFVIRGLKQADTGGGHASQGAGPGPRLRKASFHEPRNMLRLELDGVDSQGREVVTVVYIVYTSIGMLRFVGLVQPGDGPGLRAVDEAVSTLYLDYGLRQGH